MSQNYKTSNLLIVRGNPTKVRAFKRAAYERKRNTLSFYKIRPYDFFGDWVMDEACMKELYGVIDLPETVKIIEEADLYVKYFFKCNGICKLQFMSEAFGELIFEHAYVVFNKAKKRVETKGFNIYIANHNVFEFRSGYPGSESELYWEAETAGYLESLIRKIKRESMADRAYIPPVNDIGVPFIAEPEEYPIWEKQLRGKTALLIVSSETFALGPNTFPYDLVILNCPSDSFGYHPALFNIQRIDGQVVKVQGNPTKTVRFLRDLHVQVKCFVGLSDGCVAGQNYDNCIHLTEFFAFLSPILADDVLYISDRDFWLGRSVLKTFPAAFIGFPDLHFTADVIDANAVPFDTIIFPVSEPDWELLYDPTPPNYLRKYQLKRLPADTENYVFERVEVRLSNASVWDFENEFDCIIPTDTNLKALKASIPLKHGREYISNISWFINRNFELFLEEAFLEKWRTIGIGFELDSMMILRFLKALKKWKKDIPLTIHFFVLNPKRKSEISMLLKRYNLQL